MSTEENTSHIDNPEGVSKLIKKIKSGDEGPADVSKEEMMLLAGTVEKMESPKSQRKSGTTPFTPKGEGKSGNRPMDPFQPPTEGGEGTTGGAGLDHDTAFEEENGPTASQHNPSEPGSETDPGEYADGMQEVPEHHDSGPDNNDPENDTYLTLDEWADGLQLIESKITETREEMADLYSRDVPVLQKNMESLVKQLTSLQTVVNGMKGQLASLESQVGQQTVPSSSGQKTSKTIRKVDIPQPFAEGSSSKSSGPSDESPRSKEEKVKRFLSDNPSYPPSSLVRQFKLTGLAKDTGSAKVVKDVPNSAWNVKGLLKYLS